MKKLNQKGIGTLEIILIVVVLSLTAGVGWYVLRVRKINSVNSYDACLKAEGQTDFDKIDQQVDVPTCKIYGKKFIDTGKLAWDIGLRYSDVTHNDKLPPATVNNASIAPKDLVDYLKSDNAGCDPAGKTTKSVYEIVKVVENRQTKIKYGCVRVDGFMLVVKDRNGWKEISPTNMFTDDGTPSCAMINRFDISNKLEPKCFKTVNEKVVLEDNKNP